MAGRSLVEYARDVVSEVIGVGRCGTLVDWDDAESAQAIALRHAAQDSVLACLSAAVSVGLSAALGSIYGFHSAVGK